MSEILFPRLDRVKVRALHDELADVEELDVLEKVSSLSHELGFTGQTGGRRATEDDLSRIHDGVMALASRNGYPDTRTQAGQARFDSSCAVFLYKECNIGPGEALRDDVWGFMAAVMLPHVVRWRFPNFTLERLMGGEQRNAFQRLWKRAYLFDRGSTAASRWQVLDDLGEDQFEAILGRPGLSRNRRLALAIAEAYLRARERHEQLPSERLHRNSTKTLRAWHPVICFPAMDDDVLALELDRIYDGEAMRMREEERIVESARVSRPSGEGASVI